MGRLSGTIVLLICAFLRDLLQYVFSHPVFSSTFFFPANPSSSFLLRCDKPPYRLVFFTWHFQPLSSLHLFLHALFLWSLHLFSVGRATRSTSYLAFPCHTATIILCTLCRSSPPTDFCERFNANESPSRLLTEILPPSKLQWTITQVLLTSGKQGCIPRYRDNGYFRTKL